MNKFKLLSITTICIFLIVSCTYSFEIEGSLRKISDQKLQVIFQDNENTLFYNSLQESELAILNYSNAKYTEDGLLIGEDFRFDLDKRQKRDLAKSKFEIFEINEDNKIKTVQSTDFTVSFDEFCDDVSVVIINEQKKILPNDPDLCLYNLSTSQDGSYGIIWTEKGMWEISPEEKSAKKITNQKYNGKTYDELLADRINKTNDESSYVYMNDKPNICPNKNYIVYTSNRNIIGGSSIWLYDRIKGEENPIIIGKEQTYFSIISWINEDLFVISKSTKGVTKFYISNTTGQCYNLELDGANPDIIDIQANMIAYTPICNLQNEIIVSSINFAEKNISEVARVKINGALRLPSAGFSPNSKKFAFLYAPSDIGTIHHVGILNVNNNTVSTIQEKNFKDKKVVKSISIIEWKDDSSLFALAGDDKNLSTWEYRLED